MRKEILVPVASGVLTAAIVGTLAFGIGAVRRRLSEYEQMEVAKELAQLESFRDYVIERMKQHPGFKGPKGDRGIGTKGDPGKQGPAGPGAPIGTVVAFPTVAGSLPDGWLLCDGSSLSPKTYRELFEVIGTRYGGDGAADFQLPNFCGYFLRGLDPKGEVDPDGKARQFGVPQLDELKSHSHKLKNNEGRAFAYGTREGDKGHNDRFATGVDRDLRDISFEAVGGSETRPKNQVVNWIIRAKRRESPECSAW